MAVVYSTATFLPQTMFVPSYHQLQTEFSNALLHTHHFTIPQIIILILSFVFPIGFYYLFRIYVFLIQAYYVILLNPLPVISIIVLLFLLYLLLQFYLFKKSLSVLTTLFQIIPPTTVNQTPLATHEFLTALHDIGMQPHRYFRFLFTKRMYALELVATKENGIQYFLRVPTEDVPLIKKTLISYIPDISIREKEDYIPVEENKLFLSGIWWNLSEIILNNHYAFPLEEQKKLSQHDPIAYLTGHMTKFTSYEEIIVFQVVATPVNKRTHGGIVKTITHILDAISYSYSLRPYVQPEVIKTVIFFPTLP